MIGESTVLLAEIQFGPFLIEDPRVFWAQIVGFILLLLVLYYVNVPVFGRKYLSTVLSDRETRVEEVHNQIEIAITDTRKLHDDYIERLNNIELESRDRIAAAIREADAVHDDIIADARQAAAYVVRRTEEELAREQTRQRIVLRRKIVQISLDAAEEAVGVYNTDTVQRRLIGDFILHVGSTSSREAQSG